MAAKARLAQDCAPGKLSMRKIITQPPARRNARKPGGGNLRKNVTRPQHHCNT